MKYLIVILVLLEYVVSRNLKLDLRNNYNIQDLQTLHKFTKNSRYSVLNNKLQAINPDEITLLVFTKANKNGVEIHLTDANNITKVSPFNPKLQTVFYIHGWLDTVKDESSVMITNALLETENINIIIVNWDNCAKSIDYFVSKRCVPYVGKYIGQFIDTVAQVYSYSISDITVVGHSLGAHIGGHIGKYFNGSLGTIVGLDPAGPFYFKDARSDRLTEDDAQYVQAIHTCALFLGVNYNVGHSDFWPNGGKVQSGCGLNTECSHIKAYKYYAESITSNAFFARNCDSYDIFEKHECTQNSKSLMGGFNVNTSAFGTFYLDTNSETPFGMGDVV